MKATKSTAGPSSRTTLRRYQGVHRQQLFHWVGSHIEQQFAGTTAKARNAQRLKYIDCLRAALTDGIWLKVPRKPDQLGDGQLVKVTRPIACFTEWSLGQSRPHTTEYGRMGFGFSKRFILSRGGQPVIYIQDKRTGAPYRTALLALAAGLEDPGNGLTNSSRRTLRDHFDFVAHFAKIIEKPRAPRKKQTPSELAWYESTETSVRGLETLLAEEAEKIFERRFGRILHYLEEREWRIVFHESLSRHFHRGSGSPDEPDYYLRFEPGNELFTVVLPDNMTVNLALQDQEISSRLYPKRAPHVTVLSFEDIGTF